MYIGHVALRAEIVVEALRTLPPDANYPVPLATVTDNVGVLDASGRIIEHQQIVSTLVTDPIITPSAVVPLNDDRLVRRPIGWIRTGGRAPRGRWLPDLHYRSGVTLAAILIVPFPILTADDSQTNFQHLQVQNVWLLILKAVSSSDLRAIL